MDRNWTEYWTKYRHKMDQKKTENTPKEPKMNQKEIKKGQKMDRKWTENGQKM